MEFKINGRRLFYISYHPTTFTQPHVKPAVVYRYHVWKKEAAIQLFLSAYRHHRQETVFTASQTTTASFFNLNFIIF